MVMNGIRDIGIRKEILDKTDESCVRKAIYAARRSVLPIQPKNIKEVHRFLDSEAVDDILDSSYILENDCKRNIVLLSSSANLKVLSKSTAWFVDGTFKCSPKYFLQMFTIHGLVNGHYIPLVFCLFNKKTVATYKRVFQVLTEALAERKLQSAPTLIYADFEKAIQTAVHAVWSKARIRGCRFHLAQAWWRKIQKLGLSTVYNTDTPKGKFLMYFFGLPLLEPKMVRTCFEEHFQRDDSAKDENIKQFLRYISMKYIRDNARYPPELWAEMNSSIARTMNACESFHAAFNKRFYTPHPNVFLFLYVLKDVQTNIELMINTAMRKKKEATKKNANKMKYFEAQIQEYKSKKIDDFTFVKSVSYRNLPLQF